MAGNAQAVPPKPVIEQVMRDLPVTAASFIVTVYGDVVVPRGGVMWIGSLIETCAPLGINENLVRTAVSRLVANGQLAGERNGRRSFYRLAPSVRAEFAQAARLLYGRRRACESWLVLLAPDMTEDLARRHSMARMGGDVWLCPAGDDLPATAGVVLRARPVGDPAQWAPLAALWDLEGLQARYGAMLARFQPLADAVQGGEAISDEDALIARLLLVHVYRGVVLRDPGLPPAALPENWPGNRAQDLFRGLYRHLSPQADRHVADRIEGADGVLPKSTDQTEARMAALI